MWRLAAERELRVCGMDRFDCPHGEFARALRSNFIGCATQARRDESSFRSRLGLGRLRLWGHAVGEDRRRWRLEHGPAQDDRIRGRARRVAVHVAELGTREDRRRRLEQRALHEGGIEDAHASVAAHVSTLAGVADAVGRGARADSPAVRMGKPPDVG
jgi:hypothetical protein